MSERPAKPLFKTILLVSLLAFITFEIIFFTLIKTSPQTELRARDIPGLVMIQDRPLLSSDGAENTFNKPKNIFLGNWSVMYTGFTNCPHICPTGMAVLAKSLEDLEGVQGVFVTIEPEQDSLAVLKNYTNQFSKNIVALRFEGEQLKSFLQDISSESHRVDGDLIHSNAFYFVGPDGRLKAILSTVQDSIQVIKTLKVLQSESKHEV